MPKRKAETLSQAPIANGSKKAKHDTTTERIIPNLLDDSDSVSSSDEDSVGGAKLEEPEFKINEKYAKIFEHNKKREELHKCLSYTELDNPLLTPFSRGEISKDDPARKRSVWR